MPTTRRFTATTMIPRLATSLAALLAATTQPAAAAQQDFGPWTLNDGDGVCAAVLDPGGGASLALVIFPTGTGALAIVGPDIPAAEPNSTATLTLSIDGGAPINVAARATHRNGQTGYIMPEPEIAKVLDAYPAGMKMAVSLADTPIFAIDATKAAEPIAALRDCAATGHL